MQYKSARCSSVLHMLLHADCRQSCTACIEDKWTSTVFVNFLQRFRPKVCTVALTPPQQHKQDLFRCATWFESKTIRPGAHNDYKHACGEKKKDNNAPFLKTSVSVYNCSTFIVVCSAHGARLPMALDSPPHTHNRSGIRGEIFEIATADPEAAKNRKR